MATIEHACNCGYADEDNMIRHTCPECGSHNITNWNMENDREECGREGEVINDRADDTDD